MLYIIITTSFILGTALGGWLEARRHRATFNEPKDDGHVPWKADLKGTQFLSAVTPQEKFKKAKEITDIIDEP